MKEVWINHKPVDFGNAATQQKVTPGCATTEADREEQEQEQEDEMDGMIEEPPSPPDPCIDNHCKHDSKCVPTLDGEYTCKCKPGHSGKYCEQGEEECKYMNFHSVYYLKKSKLISSILSEEYTIY